MKRSPSTTNGPRRSPGASKAPLAVIQFGRVAASIFATTVTRKDGKSFDAYSISLRRPYRRADGKLADTASLRPTDLLPATYALLKCCDMIYKTDRPSPVTKA